jgi:CHAD domain-containing protein
VSTVSGSPERVIKLSASPTFDLPDLSGIVEGVGTGPREQVRVETTYFDTRDLRLARWGLSLSQGRGGWTLKLPGAEHGADRSLASAREITVSGPSRRPPDDVMALIRAFLRGASLEPVARLSTRCLLVPLTDAKGRQLAQVVDDEVSVLHGRRVAARFREVEVEVGPGGDEVLGPLLARLRQAGAGSPDPTPNHVRALGPAALDEPEVAVQDLPSDATTADVIRNALAAAVQLVLRHDPLIRVGGDPEDVHQARVGTRRLRSHLRTFRPLLDREWTDDLRGELGWLADELGTVRDREVLLERLQRLATALPPADARPAGGLLGQLAASVESARASLLEAMSSQRYFDLLDRLVAAASKPRLDEAQENRLEAPAAQVLPALALKPWRDLRRAVGRLPDQPSDEELHQVRILAKRMRYASEAVAPAVGNDAARFAKRAGALQTELGEHQDSITAQAWLRGAVTTRRRAFVAGELCALEASRTAEARARWPAAWMRLDRAKARAWMTSRPAA